MNVLVEYFKNNCNFNSKIGCRPEYLLQMTAGHTYLDLVSSPSPVGTPLGHIYYKANYSCVLQVFVSPKVSTKYNIKVLIMTVQVLQTYEPGVSERKGR